MASIREIREARMPRLLDTSGSQSNGHSSGDAELELSLERRKRILAAKIDEHTISGLEGSVQADQIKAQTEQTKAEVDLLKSKAELAQITAALSENQGNGQMQLLLGVLNILKEDKNNLFQENQQLRDRILETIAGQTQTLRDELMARVSSNGNGHPKSLVEQMGELKNVKEALDGLFPKPEVVGAIRDIEDTVRLHEIQERHEARMAELRIMSEDADHKRKLDWAKFEKDTERSSAMAGYLEKFGPAAIEALRTALPNLMRGGNGASAINLAQQVPNIITSNCHDCETPIPITKETVMKSTDESGNDVLYVVCPNTECRHPWRIESNGDQASAVPASN